MEERKTKLQPSQHWGHSKICKDICWISDGFRLASHMSYFSLVSKGRSNLLLNQYLKVKKEADEKKAKSKEQAHMDLVNMLKEEIQVLENELFILHKDKDEVDKNSQILHQLSKNNIIDANGKLR